MKRCILLLGTLFVFSVAARAQLEVNGGFTHLTGNFGLDGVHGGAGLQMNRFVTLIGEADFLWDTSKIGAFDLSPTAATVRIKSNEQNYLGGARVRIIGWKPMKTLEKRKLLPFAQMLIGVSRLNQKVTGVQGPTTSDLDVSDGCFTWVIGGGAEYTLSRKWLARGNIDFVRTHFVEEGQSRMRIKVGLAYLF